MNPATLGFVRALGTVAVVAVLSYLGDAAHLNGIVSESVAAIIAALALGLEHSIEEKTGNGLFGAVKVRK
jgi:hypothetical protein